MSRDKRKSPELGASGNSIRGRSWLVEALGFSLLLLGCNMALAQSQFSPYATASYEHNSNLFALADSASVPPGGSRADSILESIVGLDGRYLWGLQQFSFGLEGRRFDFDHNTDLDHDEYRVQARLRWELARALDGSVDYSIEHRMEPFTQQTYGVLLMETESDLGGKATLHLGPDWNLETGFKTSVLDAPQPGLPDYGLRQNDSELGVNYVGIANLSFGVIGRYEDGTYHGSDEPLDYHQTTAGLAGDYKVTGVSTLSASVGYTNRDSVGNDAGGNSAVTGSLKYTNKLTAKTQISLAFDRSVNSYITAGNSEVDTSGTASVHWEATRKISVLLSYQAVHSVFDSQAVIDPASAGRIDNSRLAEANLSYNPLTWLSIRLYDQYQKRDSNIPIYTFNWNIVGIEFTGRIGEKIPP